MAQEPSERACDRCRERRVKCDKTQPRCLRCDKLGKPCPGYDKKRKFVDEGVTLRKKYQTSTDHPSSTNDQPIFGIRGSSTATTSAGPTPANATSTSGNDSSTLLETSFPVDSFNSINRAVLGLDARDGAHNAFPPAPQSIPIDPTTEAMLLTEPPLGMGLPLADTDPMLDELWKNENFDPEFFDLVPDEYYNATGNTCGFIPNIPEIVDEVDQGDFLFGGSTSTTPLSTGFGSTGLFSADESTNLWAPESQFKTSAQITHERDHEMAYLIRHFTESVGPWMDLFDRDKHFTHLVPLKALRDALLRNAIAAVAAKQLGRVKGQKPLTPRQCQRPSAMEVLDDSTEIDWFYKAANYYDKAIAFSRQYLQAVSGNLDESSEAPNLQPSLSMANSDDLVVAVSLFSLYESLDNLDSGWLQHLAGLKSLLTAVSPAQQVENQISPALTVGRLASFWNYARADYQAAYINRQQTLLNTEDFALWKSCGLEVQPDGSLYESLECIKNDPKHCRTLAELVAHTLLWLLLRVMNYIASDEESTAKQERWDQLTRQLDQWYGNLPATYQPVAQIRHPLSSRTHGASTITTTNSTGTGTGTAHLTESFYSIDVCAAALQLYHFARILLLLHRPVSNATSLSGNRLKQYREVSNEAIRHAHEIIGIALGRPHPAIRVEMLLPLFTAGACLEENEERKVVLEILRAVEKDTGYETEGRCRELVREWGWSKEPVGIA